MNDDCVELTDEIRSELTDSPDELDTSAPPLNQVVLEIGLFHVGMRIKPDQSVRHELNLGVDRLSPMLSHNLH